MIQRNKRRQWLIRAGVTLLVLSSVCIALTVHQLSQTFGAIAASTDAPKPSELAERIAGSVDYSVPAAPLFIGGLISLLIGLFTPQNHKPN